MSGGVFAGRVRAGLLAVVLAVWLLAVALPGAAHATPAGPAAPPPGPLSQGQALARAAATGSAVPVTAATTPTSTLTANPDGTLSLTQNAEPVRAYQGGLWVPLDATLHANPDGSITPTAAASPVTLSGGGTGPLVVLADAGHQLSIGWPTPLPAPQLAGATATYPSVLPDVDLVLAVDTQGGISDTLVVKTAAAASNPAVARLSMTITAPGLSVAADPAGNLTARAPGGSPLFTAPTPLAWDSTGTAGAAPAGGAAPASTADGPGPDATVMPVPVTVDGGTLTLTPPSVLLDGPGTTFPVYIDPAWIAVGSGNNGWASVSQEDPSTNYWKNTPDPSPQKYLQVGNAGSQWSHTLLRFPIPLSTLHGAVIHSVQLTLMEENSWSCTASRLDLWAPSQNLSPTNATWNSWPSSALGTLVDYGDWAYGHSSSCPAHSVNFAQTQGDNNTALISTIVNDVASSHYYRTFALTGSGEDTDNNSWKEFLNSSPSLTITYDRPPATPTGLSTDPVTSCTNPAGDLVGDTDVTLFAPLTDPDGGSVGAIITLTNTVTGATVATSNPATLVTSGGIEPLLVHAATLEKSANGAVTKFSWNAQATDTNLQSGISQTCYFQFDPTRPSDKPTITSPGPATIGHALQIAVAPSGAGVTPGGYLYQLNGGPPDHRDANPDGTGTITITPNRYTNVLTVTELSPSGNLGTDSAVLTFPANPDTNTHLVDSDVTGDGIPDLLTTGRTTHGDNLLPAGIWQAAGKDTGQVSTAAVNIGANGDGFSPDRGPGDFSDARVITGRFTDTGPGTARQDLLAYYPQGHAGHNPGKAEIIPTNGDGSVLTGQVWGNATELDPPALTDTNINTDPPDGSPPGDNPIQVASAGLDTAFNTGLTDLITINGDSTNGYQLDYYIDSPDGSFTPYLLPTPTPTGVADWNTWTLASTQTTTGTTTSTDLFLWKAGTGDLWLWRNITLTMDHTTGAPIFGVGSIYHLRNNNWYASPPGTTAPAIQAADSNSDGIPDLWTVTTGGQVTAWTPNLATPTITAQPTVQTLTTASHAWMLDDNTTGAVTGADTGSATTPLPVTGSGGAAWNTGDLYKTDITLDGTNSYLSATGPAVHTNASFTISAWVKPQALGGTLLSQPGTHNAGFALFADAPTGQWTIGMTTTDLNPTVDYARNQAGPVNIGIWVHLTATYNAATGIIALYVDGNPSGTTTHTTKWDATGALQIGRTMVNGAYTGYFKGQIADIQTWNQALTPVQVADLSETPGYIMLQPNLDYPSGTTWTSRCGTMTFTAGQLSIKMTCTKTGTVTYGTTGHPNAVLVLQSDGNLVIYTSPPQTGPIWATGTSSYPGATVFFQNDGNLVVYTTDGRPVWASGTWN